MEIQGDSASSVKPIEGDIKIDDFHGQLKKWREEALKRKVMAPAEMRDELFKIENDLKLNDDDMGMLGLFSEMMGVIATQERNQGKVKKEDSVALQQAFVEEVLKRSVQGVFIDDKFPAFFLAVSEVYEKLRDERLFSESGMESEGGFLSGIRGMISAALLFSRAGFEVTLPPVKWDMYHDIDLLVERNDSKYSVSVKSENGFVDENNEAFSVRQNPRPQDMPEDYYKNFLKQLWVNIPSQTTKDAGAYCEKGAKSVAIGVPNDISVSCLNANLNRLGIN